MYITTSNYRFQAPRLDRARVSSSFFYVWNQMDIFGKQSPGIRYGGSLLLTSSDSNISIRSD